VIGTFKLCVGTDGSVLSVSVAYSTGFAGYDDTIRSTIAATWKYKPIVVDGAPAPVCSAVTFLYKP
jgi:hypothetical protein